MRTKARRFTGITGAALALASGALVVLGATPASAASTGYWIHSSLHNTTLPPFNDLVADTRSAADQKCVATYGLRANAA